MHSRPHYRLSGSIILSNLWLYGSTCTRASSPPVALRSDLPPLVFAFHVNIVCNDTLSRAQMLLWPSYQAEVIFATPPKGGPASPLWLKALLSPRPKWQTWFYLYILTMVPCGECRESYLKLYEDSAGHSPISGILSIYGYFLTFVQQQESLLSSACECWLQMLQNSQILR